MFINLGGQSSLLDSMGSGGTNYATYSLEQSSDNVARFEDFIKEEIKKEESSSGLCPSCGYCPHCGRHGHGHYHPYNPYFPGTTPYTTPTWLSYPNTITYGVAC